MKKLIFVPLIAALVCAVSAQLYPTKLGLVGSVAFHLGEDRVQSELKLSTAQVGQIAESLSNHSKEQDEINKAMQTAKPDQYQSLQARVEKLESATVGRLLGFLTVNQKKRFTQLAIQDCGPFALRNADVAKMIALTPDQRIKIQAISAKTVAALDELSAKMAAELEAAPAGKTGDKKRALIVSNYEPKNKALESKGELELLSLLTAPQKAKWKGA